MANFIDGILNLNPTPSPQADSLPIPLAPKKEILIPTREQMLRALGGLIDGTIASPIGAYNTIKELPGTPNSSPQIDKLIKLQGGQLGSSYCQLGQQQILDDLCAVFGVNRKYVEIPEGASTQTVFNLVPDKYKLQNPGSLYWVTWVNEGTWSGHVGMVLEGAGSGQFKTAEFNTSIRNDGKVVRDGEGFAIAIRKESGMSNMKIRGYTDVYTAIIDGLKRQIAES